MIDREWVKLFRFLKKLFGNTDGTSDLMERAMNSAMMDQMNASQLSNISDSLRDDDHMLEQFMRENQEREFMNQQMHDDQDREFMEQQMRDMHDPYLNPGQDIVVDESYHGIDHGSDDSFHHHDF